MELVRVEQVAKVFRTGDLEVRALQSVNFTIEEGEFVCILGPSGCGKSSLLNILAGLDGDFTGAVRVKDTPLQPGAAPAYRTGYVFQDPRLLPWLTVEENIYFALECLGVPRETWGAAAEKFIALVGLGEFRDSFPRQLSGGMRQRSAIARAFAVDPDLLLMDEPFSGLDELTARDLRYELLDIWNKQRKTVIFVTHNALEAAFLADRVLLMKPRPGRFYKDIEITLPRPRDYEDPEIFALRSWLTRQILAHR